MPSNQQFVDIDGNRLKLTSLDKVLYPETGTTKADVLDHMAKEPAAPEPARQAPAPHPAPARARAPSPPA